MKVCEDYEQNLAIYHISDSDNPKIATYTTIEQLIIFMLVASATKKTYYFVCMNNEKDETVY